jgi:two-component system, chemotaxis family, chemotaxis protein CheY
MKILIADDSKAMRMIVIRNLRQGGFGHYDYIEAENGKDCLDKVQALAPDVVLSDWNMPEMNGLECLRALRQAGNEVRFGFVTSESTPEMREKAIAAGAGFLLAKPFTADDLADALMALVRSR